MRLFVSPGSREGFSTPVTAVETVRLTWKHSRVLDPSYKQSTSRDCACHLVARGWDFNPSYTGTVLQLRASVSPGSRKGFNPSYTWWQSFTWFCRVRWWHRGNQLHRCSGSVGSRKFVSLASFGQFGRTQELSVEERQFLYTLVVSSSCSCFSLQAITPRV